MYGKSWYSSNRWYGGGGNSLTSKVAIIGKPSVKNADVDYTFAQVSLDQSKVDIKGNCGNISSGVGIFCVNENIIKVKDGTATIRIYNTNTKKIIISKFEVKNNKALSEGDLQIAGVPGSGANIEVIFTNPQGAVTNRLLPTNKAVQTISTSFGQIPISIVDAANPLVFMNAKSLGLSGIELPNDFDKQTLDKIEEVRSIAAELCGFASKHEATSISPAVPKATIISSPQDYIDIAGKTYKNKDQDIMIRMMSMQRPHQALAITGSVCITMASKIKDTLVWQIAKDKDELNLAHPSGIMKTKFYKTSDGEAVAVLRTARVIMRGTIYTKKSY